MGLNRCRATDRFWVTQCYHCRKFGHIAEKCNKKDVSPRCAFCAGTHASRGCQDKATPCCVNCSSLDNPPVGVNHFSLSLRCPVMVAERQRVMENTNFSSSSLGSLVVGLINIRSIRNKMIHVTEIMNESHIDILCITESWLVDSDINII